jgi:hypothetical protein
VEAGAGRHEIVEEREPLGLGKNGVEFLATVAAQLDGAERTQRDHAVLHNSISERGPWVSARSVSREHAPIRS